jgi:hypothetical protein
MNHELNRQDALDLEDALRRCRSADEEIEKIELGIQGQKKLLAEAEKRRSEAYADRRHVIERLNADSGAL